MMRVEGRFERTRSITRAHHDGVDPVLGDGPTQDDYGQERRGDRGDRQRGSHHANAQRIQTAFGV
jgi:hypothetical protein